MRRFEISTSQRLNVVGWFGAVSFIFSPFLEAVGYWGLMRELANTSYSRDFLEPGVFLVLGSVGFLGGLVMVIVGRDQNHIVREVDSDPTKRLWAPDEGRGSRADEAARDEVDRRRYKEAYPDRPI